MADITRGFRGNGYDEHAEVLEWTYEDMAAGGAKDVLMAPLGMYNVGLLISGQAPIQGATCLVCSIKNNSGAPITWTTAPYWRGTNNPDIKIPNSDDGFALAIGDGRAVDQAFPDTIADGEEQSCVIDCSKIPRGIFPVIEPTKQNINISLLMRVVRKQ